MIRGEMRKTGKRWLNKAEHGTEEKWKMGKVKRTNDNLWMRGKRDRDNIR